MEVIAIGLFAIFSVSISILQIKVDKRRIVEQVGFRGGEILKIEKTTLLKGPFVPLRKGNTIYRFEYRKDNGIREGWAKFGDPWGPAWWF